MPTASDKLGGHHRRRRERKTRDEMDGRTRENATAAGRACSGNGCMRCSYRRGSRRGPQLDDVLVDDDVEREVWNVVTHDVFSMCPGPFAGSSIEATFP